MRAAKPRAHHVQVAKNIPLLPPKGAQGFLPLTKTHAPQQKKPPWWEAHVLQLECNPLLPRVEKAHVHQEDTEQPKIKK